MGEQQAVEEVSNQVVEQPAGESPAPAAESRPNVIRPQHNGPNLTPRDSSLFQKSVGETLRSRLATYCSVTSCN